jgi:hypothetical protein
MAFFDFHKLNRWLAKTQPTRMPPLVHPEKVPVTMRRFPEDFDDYRYSGPAIEKITGCQGTRHPVLVARLIRYYRSPNGVIVEEEMTASVKDLKKGRHPQAEDVASALCVYFETKTHRGKKSDAAKREPPAAGYARQAGALFEAPY